MYSKFKVGDRVHKNPAYVGCLGNLYNPVPDDEVGVVIKVCPSFDEYFYELSFEGREIFRTEEVAIELCKSTPSKINSKQKIEKVMVYQFEKDRQVLLMFCGVDYQQKGRARLYWSFEGTKIPFPIASRSWFRGMSPKTMIESIETTGYKFVSNTNLVTGKTFVQPHSKDEILSELSQILEEERGNLKSER